MKNFDFFFLCHLVDQQVNQQRNYETPIADNQIAFNMRNLILTEEVYICE